MRRSREYLPHRWQTTYSRWEKMVESWVKNRRMYSTIQCTNCCLQQTELAEIFKRLVSFLITRVQAPDEDDWGKLKRVLKYMKGTQYLKLTLSADAMNFAIHWYINRSHQIHKDCWGQTGSLVTFGAGAVASSSNKQKCNTKSSTKTEIIALHNKLSDVIWMSYFVECQRFDIDDCIILQDNLSALSLEKNRRMSSSKHTKHIKAKYFLIKDYYNAGEIDLQYCPTGQMWEDVLTKSLQGQLFRYMWVFLQNYLRDYDDDLEWQEEQSYAACAEWRVTPTMALGEGVTIWGGNKLQLLLHRESVLINSEQSQKYVLSLCGVECQNITFVECQNITFVECQNITFVECQNITFVDCQNITLMECQNITLSTSWLDRLEWSVLKWQGRQDRRME